MTTDITIHLALFLYITTLAYTAFLLFRKKQSQRIKPLCAGLFIVAFFYCTIRILISSKLKGVGYFEPFLPVLGINLFELITISVGLIITFFYLKRNVKSYKAIGILLILIGLLFYISVEKSSQMLASDEGISVMEFASIKYTAQMGVWGNGALRLSYILIGIPLSLFKPGDYNSLLSVAKMLHWIGGIVMMLGIFSLLKKYVLKITDEEKFVLTFILFMMFTLITPMNLIAWKIANYDLYAMFVATAAMFLLGIAYLTKNLNLTIVALVISVAGSQEKLNVSPLIIVSLIMLGYLAYNKYKKLYIIPLVISAGVVASIIEILLMYGLIGVARDLDFPTKGTVSILYPLVSWGWPLVSAKIASNLAYFNSTYSYYLLGALVVISCVCSILLSKFDNLFDNIGSKISSKLALIVMIAALAIGVWGTFNTQAYEGFFVQAPKGTYGHDKNPNANYTWYPGATTAQEFHIKNIAFYYAVFINAIPSVFWVLLAFIVIFDFTRRNSNKTKYSFIWDLAVIMCFLMPLGYALTSTWLVNRYYDLYHYIFELYILIRLYSFINSNQSLVKKKALIAVTALVLVIELWPFAPVYAAFRPFWSDQSESYNKNFVQGRMDVAWQGWGEEIMIAQKEIFKRCLKTKSCEKTIITANFRGAWLYKYKGKQPNEILLGINVDSDHIPHKERLGPYTKDDYFIFTRGGLKRTVPVPGKEVPAEFTISYRGYVQTWVYRGDVLAKHGISYETD